MKSIVFQLLLQPLLLLLHQTKCKSFGNICSVLRMFIYSIVYPIMYAQFNHYDIVSLASSLVHHGKHLCIKETHRLWHTCAFQHAGIKRNLFKEKKSSFDSLRSAKKRHPKHKLTLLLVKCSRTFFYIRYSLSSLSQVTSKWVKTANRILEKISNTHNKWHRFRIWFQYFNLDRKWKCTI